MKILADLLTGIVAFLHLSFMALEMFFWQKDIGLHVFKMTPEMASQTAILAQNQGLYNGILAAGLIWSFFIYNGSFQKSVRTFFLISIIIAGVFGAITAKTSILFVQALPALLALIVVLMSNQDNTDRLLDNMGKKK